MNKERPLPSFPAPDTRRRPSEPTAFAAAPRSKIADPAITSVLAAVDQARLAKTVKSLAKFPTRHSLSPHNVEAAK
jgi:hypothetical protein